MRAASQIFGKAVRYGDPIGSLATILSRPGQARKGAAKANDSCAGMWLVGLPPNLLTAISIQSTSLLVSVSIYILLPIP